MVSTLLILTTAPVASVTAGTVEIDLDLSEDVVVKNSDIDMTVTVRDATSGEPIDGCMVMVHIERKVGNGGNGDHMHGTPMEVPSRAPNPRKTAL